jgi:hypothetical protein
MALRCTLTFYGEDGESVEHHKKWYHYLVVANPGSAPGSAVASIITLSDARAESNNSSSGAVEHTISTSEGGMEASLKLAEDYLTQHHPGLKRITGKARS